MLSPIMTVADVEKTLLLLSCQGGDGWLHYHRRWGLQVCYDGSYVGDDDRVILVTSSGLDEASPRRPDGTRFPGEITALARKIVGWVSGDEPVTLDRVLRCTDPTILGSLFHAGDDVKFVGEARRLRAVYRSLTRRDLDSVYTQVTGELRTWDADEQTTDGHVTLAVSSSGGSWRGRHWTVTVESPWPGSAYMRILPMMRSEIDRLWWRQPAVKLTTSSANGDGQHAYDLVGGVACVFAKAAWRAYMEWCVFDRLREIMRG